MFRFIDIRRNTSLKTRITVLAAFVMLCAIVCSTYSLSEFEKLFDQRETAIKLFEHQTSNLQQISSKIKSLFIEEKNFLLQTEPQERVESEKKMDEGFNEIEDKIRDIEAYMTSRTEINSFNDLFREYKKYNEINREVIKLFHSNEHELAKQLSSTGTSNSYTSLVKKIDILSKGIEEKRAADEQLIEKNKSQIKSSIYKFLIFLILLCSTLTFVFIRDLHLAYNRLITNLKKFEKGKFSIKKLNEYDDEIGQISTSYNRIFIHLGQLTRFATEISKGNYDTDLEKLSNEDELGNSLLHLQKNLKENRESEEKRRIDDDNRNWISRGLTLFSDISRQNTDDVKELSYNVIKHLVKYVHANQCCIFLQRQDEQGDHSLMLSASIAFDRRKYLNSTIKLGDGLIGTCAIEKQTIYLKKVPDDYIMIGSGLGEAKPSALLLVPLKLDNHVLGVIEIASFNEFKEHEISFIEKVSENIAISISTATANERTEQLLKETKLQSETLIRQEEQTRQQLELMSARQESMHKQQAEMQGMISVVESSLIKAEYDVSGTLITANALYLSTVESRLDELKGQNVKNFVPEEKLEKFNQYWQNLCNGIPYDGIMKHSSKSGKDIWMVMTYAPIKDSKGQVSKIIFLATNITKAKKSEIESVKRISELEDQLNTKTLELEETRLKYQEQLDKELKISIQLDKQNEEYIQEMEIMHQTWRKQLNEVAKLHTELAKQKKIASTYEKELEILKTRFEINSKNIPLEAENTVEQDRQLKHLDKWLDSLEGKPNI